MDSIRGFMREQEGAPMAPVAVATATKRVRTEEVADTREKLGRDLYKAGFGKAMIKGLFRLFDDLAADVDLAGSEPARAYVDQDIHCAFSAIAQDDVMAQPGSLHARFDELFLPPGWHSMHSRDETEHCVVLAMPSLN